MAITLTEQNWLALAAASSLPNDLTGLISIMRDNRVTDRDIRACLERIRLKAQFVADHCAAAIDRLPPLGPPGVGQWGSIDRL